MWQSTSKTFLSIMQALQKHFEEKKSVKKTLRWRDTWTEDYYRKRENTRRSSGPLTNT